MEYLELLNEPKEDRRVVSSPEHKTILLINPTRTRAQETIQFRVTEYGDTFWLKTPIEIEEAKLMVALTSWEVPYSVFNLR